MASTLDSDTVTLAVVVPAYNEEARIGATLRTMLDYFSVQDYALDLVVVDDGSTDRTLEEVRKSVPDGGVRTLSYGQNRGKGHAVRHGMTNVSADFVLFSDADLATPIEEVEKLFEALRAGAEIAIGSRDVPGARLERRQSFVRELGGKLFNRFVRVLAVPGIHDTQCGFKLFTRAAAANVFSRCRIDNFSFDVEVLYLARQLGYGIAEVPVRWRHQEGSKVRFVRDALRMVKTLWRIRCTDYEIRQADKRVSTP